MSKKTLSDCRSLFKDFFKKNGHQIIDSSPLVPQNDPTLMFTNSGMVQFKNVFTGLEKFNFKRATTSQKCVRAGGKHNDLENVGYTPRHHTFFEMLGNFSFGDYFKELAIEYAWNLITKEFQINKDRLIVTVFHDDNEAFSAWKKISGFSDNKIIKISTNDNFWSMGDTGPCGPCSEIFFDHGEKFRGGLPGTKEQDGDRFVEIWNLVFMQFEQISKDKRIKLPKPSVDTGMGLERISAVMQSTHDNYEIDLFKNIIHYSEQLIKTKISSENISSYRVIADHLRATTFLISDGVLPSNEGRGYVLRRIMRRAMRHAYTLNAEMPILNRIVPEIVDTMQSEYPELKRAENLIIENLRLEEERFSSMLKNGMKILNQELDKNKNNSFSGEVAFKLYDTYGFPLDLTQDFLKNKKIIVDEDQFNKSMEASKAKARASWKGSGSQHTERIWFEIKEKYGSTEFLGYNFLSSEGKILAIIDKNKELNSFKNKEEITLVTNQTPFYGESGGQVGDIGVIYNEKFKFNVMDTKKVFGSIFLHIGKLENGDVNKGDFATLKVDINRRNNIAANHSATHLLHEALRRTLGKHVVQKGAYYGPDRLRFDFSHSKPMTDSEIFKINESVNKIIKQNEPVSTRLMSPKDAMAEGALALFGEKYGEEARVVTMGTIDKKTYSIELCGGTHVKKTGEIEEFSIIGQMAIAAGIRRVEALRGEQLKKFFMQRTKDKDISDQKKISQIVELENKLKTFNTEIPKKNYASKDEHIQELKRVIENLEFKNILLDKNKNKKILKDFKNIKILFHQCTDFPVKKIQEYLVNETKEKNNFIIVFYSINENKISLAIKISNDITKTYKASDLIKKLSNFFGQSKGGGKDDFAQASGGSDLSKIEKSVDFFVSILN